MTLNGLQKSFLAIFGKVDEEEEDEIEQSLTCASPQVKIELKALKLHLFLRMEIGQHKSGRGNPWTTEGRSNICPTFLRQFTSTAWELWTMIDSLWPEE